MTKALLVHIPKLFIENNDVKSSLNYSAMGLYSLAFELKKEGIDVLILNLGIEKYLDKNFLLSKYIKENNIDFAAFSLHWHYQSYDTLEVIKKVKEKNKNVFISLGGLSASFFADEILENFPYVDCIVKGEGEKSLKELIKVYKTGDFEKVPNLCYRKNGKIIQNEDFFVAKNEDLDMFKFFAPELMKNFNKTTKLPFILNYKKENELETSSIFQGISLGRGCLGNCAWCGGGFLAMKETSKRDFISYRKIENVISEIKNLKENYNTEIFRFSFDPNPKNREYIIELFEKIKEEFKGNLKVSYNLDGFPDFEFLKSFKKAFSKDSILSLSPVFYNEELRKKYKSFFYTNKELEEVLEFMEKEEIKSEIYFSIIKGVPDIENEKSEKYGAELKEKFKFIENYFMYEIDLEPASIMYKNPAEYGIKDEKKNFIDYYNENKSIENSFENLEIFKN